MADSCTGAQPDGAVYVSDVWPHVQAQALVSSTLPLMFQLTNAPITAQGLVVAPPASSPLPSSNKSAAAALPAQSASLAQASAAGQLRS